MTVIKQPATAKQATVLQTRQDAEFALTPAGQAMKQFEIVQRKGQMFATSTIVPETYRGNIGNCIIAIDMADRMGANPLMVMQNLYIVHGNPSFSSKFLIASINASHKFTPLRFEFKGEEGKKDYGCRCYAYESNDTRHTEPLYGDWITQDMVDKEGWAKKPGSKWSSMPNQMFRYRAAAFWQRIYCPEISMGLMTSEEAQDVVDVDYEEVPEEVEKLSQAEEMEEARKELETKKAAMKEKPASEAKTVEPAKLF